MPFHRRHTNILLSFTAKSELTQEIVGTTSFSSDKTTIIAYWKQEDKKIYTNGLPRLKDEALSILSGEPKRFFQIYGDKYVSGVTLGKMFYIVYQADTTNFSESTKSTVKKAMELNIKKILGAKLTQTEENFVSQKLSNVSITSKTIGYGISNFIGPYSNVDFNNLINLISSSQSAVIARELKDYYYTGNYPDTFFDVSEYIQMARSWKKHKSYLEYIYSNTRISTNLKYNCMSALNEINTQLNLVYSLDANAAYPTQYLSTYNGLYNTYLTEMNIAPKWHTMPVKSVRDNETLNLDFGYIGDVEVLKIEATAKDAFFELGISYSLTFYQNNDGNLFEIKTINLSKNNRKDLLYEGLKYHDLFSIKAKVVNNSLVRGYVKIICSFEEKMTDLIWLYVNGYL